MPKTERDLVDEIADAVDRMYPQLPPTTQEQKDKTRARLAAARENPMPEHIAEKLVRIWHGGGAR